MKWLVTLLIAVIFLPRADAASLKTIRLLDGKAWFAVPTNLSPVDRQLGPETQAVDLVALVSPDHRLSVLATYGSHVMRRIELQSFLEAKVSSYDTLNEKHRHFRWINHGLVEHQGREWAQVSFSRDVPSPAKGETYARWISTVLEGHLLELWALSRGGQKSVVDKIIESLQVPR